MAGGRLGSCSHPWPDRLQGTGVGMGCTRLAGVDSSGQRDSQRERLYTRQPGDLCCPRLPLAARPRGWAQVSMPDRGQGSGLTSESFCQQRFKATTLETQSKLDVRRSAMDPPGDPGTMPSSRHQTEGQTLRYLGAGPLRLSTPGQPGHKASIKRLLNPVAGQGCRTARAHGQGAPAHRPPPEPQPPCPGLVSAHPTRQQAQPLHSGSGHTEGATVCSRRSSGLGEGRGSRVLP